MSEIFFYLDDQPCAGQVHHFESTFGLCHCGEFEVDKDGAAMRRQALPLLQTLLIIFTLVVSVVLVVYGIVYWGGSPP